MPLINVVRGERIPTAFTTVRTPVVRIPVWLLVFWWTVKGLARTVVFLVRHWPLTLPAAVVLYLWSRYGWLTLVLALIVVTAGSLAWWHWHSSSFWRFAGHPALGRWRRLWCYRRHWTPAMATCGLATAFAGDRFIAQLVKVRTNRVADLVTVRLLPGQTPDDYATAAHRLAYTFRVRETRVRADKRPDRVVLVMLRGDPLAAIVAPLPVPDRPDLAGLALAIAEDGTVYRLRLAGSHVLIVGATGAGKGSVVWALTAALAGGVRSGLVRLWVFDPKGGMELAGGLPMFDRFACDDPAAMATVFEDAVRIMRTRAARLRGITRQHRATVDDPAYVLIVDELAALTAYVGDRKVRDRIRESLSLLLSQGRAVGVHVVAALQDPRKDVLPFRDLFPTRIALRLTEPEQIDLVLGGGARDRGAFCDLIPETSPGVGYVAVDGRREPVKVRFAWHSDEQIAALVSEYGTLRILDPAPLGGGR